MTNGLGFPLLVCALTLPFLLAVSLRAFRVGVALYAATWAFLALRVLVVEGGDGVAMAVAVYVSAWHIGAEAAKYAIHGSPHDKRDDEEAA